VDGKNNPIDVTNVDVSMNGIELQDREFFAAIKEGREPNASVAQALPAMTPTSSNRSSWRRRSIVSNYAARCAALREQQQTNSWSWW
jgi:hypothetical protein